MNSDDLDRSAAPADATGELRQASPALILRAHGPDGREVTVGDGGEIGRAAECDVCLTDGLVSRRHAAFRIRGGRWSVEDLGSRNGTWVNEQRVTTPVAISRGDRVRFGNTTFDVAGGDFPAEAREEAGGDPAESHVAFHMSGHQSGDIRMAGRDNVDRRVSYYSDHRSETHYYGNNPWLILANASGASRALMIVGMFVSFAGFGCWGYPIVRAVTEGFSAPPDSFEPPEFQATPWLPLGAGLAFAGMVLFLIGIVMSRRDRG